MPCGVCVYVYMYMYYIILMYSAKRHICGRAIYKSVIIIIIIISPFIDP